MFFLWFKQLESFGYKPDAESDGEGFIDYKILLIYCTAFFAIPVDDKYLNFR